MKPLSRNEIAVQNDQAIETRRVARSIVNREPELNLKSLVGIPAKLNAESGMKPNGIPG
jgi:hypothetical protein